MTRLLLFPLGLLLLAGCASTDTMASPGSSAPSSAQAQCDKAGGQWRGGACERMESGGGGY